MSTVFAFNTLVWLKQPGYPWWPGIVLDPTSIELALIDGCDTCVLCLPSASSSVAFANSANRSELLRFTPAKDDLMIQQGKQHAECAVAIEEALSIYKQQNQQEGEYEESGQRLSKARQTAAHSRGERNRHVREKRSRDEFPESRRRLRHRPNEDHEKGAHKSNSNFNRARNEHDDVYEREALCEPPHGAQEADAAFFESVLRNRRRPVGDAELESARQRLDGLQIRNGRQMSDAEEDELLDALSPFTMMSVTLEQLVRVKIGVAVGRFLSRDYPVRVVSLASAILRFWFRHLPAATQQRLCLQTEIEAVSNDTTAGSEHESARLGALGIQLEDCFTDAEVADTIRDTAAVARAIEEELVAANDEDIRIATLQVMRSEENGDVRRALLSGGLSAPELVKHAIQPESLASLLGKRKNTISVTSPKTSAPQLNKLSAFENFTSLYACPSCGLREAVMNAYSVQAHDNLAAIITCIKCGHTWSTEG